MFEVISEKLNNSLSKISAKTVLTEENIAEALKEVKVSLLEADVNYRVVNSVIKTVKSKAIGATVIKSLTAGQQFVQIMADVLTDLMGGENQALIRNPSGATVLMLVGLQGSGKTTTCGKLANFLKKKGEHPYLVPLDIYRPAAVDQLRTLANQVEISCYPTDPKAPILDTLNSAMKKASEEHANYIILDTAGRLQIDEMMMDELTSIQKTVDVNEVILVTDSMAGQESVNVASAFHKKLGITGTILTKMDGDSRGGAALSIRAVTEKPIKFVGVGERVQDFELFHPERVAQKILGMGDVMTLIEKAKENFSENEMLALEEKMRKNSFTLDDFAKQITQMQKMGPLKDILKMIPGVANKLPENLQGDEKLLNKTLAIISSMTKEERENHLIINPKRRTRIAKGSGTQVNDVNRIIKQFSDMKKMMRQFTSPGGQKKAMGLMKNMMKGAPPGMGA